MSLIPAVKRLRHEDGKFKTTLDYAVEPYLKTPRTKDIGQWQRDCRRCPNAMSNSSLRTDLTRTVRERRKDKHTNRQKVGI